MKKRMSFSLPFSLKHIALAKIAISVFNNYEIKALIQQERTDGMLILTSFAHQQEMFEKFMRILKNIPLPSDLKNNIAWLIIPINHEFDYWRTEHSFLTEDVNVDLQNFLRWRSSGTIDWKKTAENLVRNKTLDVTKRFILSCLYCLKNKAFAIWNEMSELQKESIIQDKEFSVVEHWVRWLKHGTEIDWSPILRNYMETNHQFFHETPLSLSCFSQELARGERKDYFEYHIRNSALCNDDLLGYVHQIELNERIGLFKEHAYLMLFLHLEWPYQEQFMFMAHSIWEYLRENEFLYLFLYLTASQQQMRRDFDYSKLAQEFWQGSPAHFKEFVRNALRLI